MKKFLWHPAVRLPIVLVVWTGMVLFALWLFKVYVDFLWVAFHFHH